MISASVWTVEITPPRLCPETIQYVDSSSANRLSCSTTSRNTAPTTVMAATMAAGWPHAAASHLRASEVRACRAGRKP